MGAQAALIALQKQVAACQAREAAYQAETERLRARGGVHGLLLEMGLLAEDCQFGSICMRHVNRASEVAHQLHRHAYVLRR